MVETVVNAVIALLVVAVIVYVIATWRADNDGCDETQCGRCPFPCEKHTERGAKK